MVNIMDNNMQRIPVAQDPRMFLREGTVGECLEKDSYYGFHRTAVGWVYRVWAPEARQVYLTGEFNGWNRTSDPMLDLGNGNWVVYLWGKNTLWDHCRVETIVNR